MTFKRLIVWAMISTFLLVRVSVFAQTAHDEGLAAGQAASPVVQGMVNTPSATSVVPGYTTTPPETAYAGKASFGADVNAKLASCASTPNDPTCQALKNAIASANTPRPNIGPSEAAVVAASQIAKNPLTDLGSLAAYYSGCVTTDVTTPSATSSATGCPSSNVFCMGTSCFNIGYTNDADFAHSMSMLEATREAGVYLDIERMQVFKGESNRCREKFLKNCCYTDGAGAGMTNQSAFGVGTRLVYDILMNSGNRDFVMAGMSSLLSGAGFSGTFSSYGFTIAVNGAALPTGSTALYASSMTAGEGVVVAFDPWSLAIAVIIYVVLSMMSCNEEEARLSLMEGARLCRTIGSYCSSCIRIFGHCVSCIEHTTTKCCFNSMLARIVNEQGRVQIGKGWGGSENPDCSGFTVAQLQTLDFAAMDLSEFYASLVPKSPELSILQTNVAGRIPTCYYGHGKC